MLLKQNAGPKRFILLFGKVTLICGIIDLVVQHGSILNKDHEMSIITIVVVLIIIGFLLGIINTYIPMAGSIKSILNAVVIIGVIVWLLSVFGLIPPIGNLRLK